MQVSSRIEKAKYFSSITIRPMSTRFHGMTECEQSIVPSIVYQRRRSVRSYSEH